MNSLADIKRRLASVRQTRQITGAMETISVAKLRKSLERFEENSAYFEILEKVMSDIVLQCGSDMSEYTTEPKSGKDVLLVIAADKGLCGSFNHDVFKVADALITDNTEIAPVGQMASEHYKHRSNVDGKYVSYAYSPDYSGARRIAEDFLARFGSDMKSVTVVYTKMIGRSSWSVQKLGLLPFKSDSAENVAPNAAKPEFEPSPKSVLERLVPLYLGGVIYGALVSSSAAENSAKRAAMSAATKNADEMIAALSVEYNRARQSSVTAQITEIIGSSQALGGK